MREKLGRLVRNWIPGRTGVGADVDGSCGVVGGSNKNARGGTVEDIRSLVKGNESQALEVTVVGIPLWTRAEGSDSLEGRHLGESRAAVGRLPQTVTASGTEKNDLGVFGVDGESLAHSATRHIAADLEGERGDLPGLTLVGAAGDTSIVGIPVTWY